MRRNVIASSRDAGQTRAVDRIGIPISIAALSIWLIMWLWTTRNYQLDDSFITLCYARNVLENGHFGFNSMQTSFGASSPLYSLLVAILYRPLDLFATKTLSVASYLLLVGLTVCLAVRAKRDDIARLFWLLTLVLSAPIGIRWLTDGMETAGAALMGIALGYVGVSVTTRPTTVARYLGLVVVGAVATLLRPEFAATIAAASVAMVLLRLARARKLGTVPFADAIGFAVRESHLTLGCLFALLVVGNLFGHLEPDTAIAKAVAEERLSAYEITNFARQFIVSGFFGLGLVTVWLVTFWSIIWKPSDTIWPHALVNLVFPALALLAIARGQVIAVRYFVPILMFAISWNLGLLVLTGTRVRAPNRFLSRPVLGAFVILLIVEFAFEGFLFHRLAKQNSDVVAEMRSQNLAELAGQQGSATEVGYIGYFTHGQICDVAGLINGHDFASLDSERRAKICASRKPQFTFFAGYEEHQMSRYMKLDDLKACHRYNIATLKGDEWYTLRTSREWQQKVCGNTTD